MAQVQVISPTGELGTIDSSDLQNAIQGEGYKLATPSDIAESDKQHQYGEGLANIAKAGLEGAARGASFGGTDYLLPHLPFGPTKEALSERKKRNPISSGVGEAAGVLGSLALAPEGGLPGLVGKLGANAGEIAAGKTASSILGKIGQASVGNAVQGAFYGAGNVLSEEALGDPGLTAQKALSQIGLSGLLGGALGGAIKAGEMAAPSIAEKAGELGGKAFDKASSFVSGLPEEEITALRANRGLGEISSSAAKPEGESLLGLGSVGMAAHSMGIPGKVVGGTLAAYDALKNPALTMSRLANLENVIQKATKAITSNANAIFKGGIQGAAESVTPLIASKLTGEELTNEYEKAVDKIQKASSHPEGFMEVMNGATEALYPHAPKVTGQIQQTAGTALQFLQAKIPSSTNEGPLSEPYSPSQSEIGKFMHYYEVVNNPIDSLKELRMGTLSPDTIETLQAVHPKLYEDMRSQLLGKVMENKGKIPYQTKSALSMFLQEPLDESMRPSSMLLTQTAYAMPSKSENAKVPQMGSTGSGSRLAKLNVAGRATTGTQKVNLGQKL